MLEIRNYSNENSVDESNDVSVDRCILFRYFRTLKYYMFIYLIVVIKQINKQFNNKLYYKTNL